MPNRFERKESPKLHRTNAPTVSQPAARRFAPPARQARYSSKKMGPDEYASRDYQGLPPTGTVHEGDGDLGAPLLIQPLLAGRRECEFLGSKEVTRVEHRVTCSDPGMRGR
jgi:hypothetical protein